ncbi:MAG: SdpI family protein [Gammaproteobacteria bacterium]
MSHPPFVVPAILLILLSVPLVLQLVPRNRFYGVRTRKSLSDDTTWYAVNRYGGWLFLLAGVIYLAVAAASPAGAWWIHLGVFAAPLIAALVLIARYQRRL